MDLMNVLVTSQYLRKIGGGGGGSGEGGGGYAYKHLVSNGEATLTTTVETNTIYIVEGYTNVIIETPQYLNDQLFWDCYFFIEFADAPKVSLKLPEGMKVNGDTPNYVKPKDVWEISMNKQGGAVCFRT
jgi:hypothetical protein